MRLRGFKVLAVALAMACFGCGEGPSGAAGLAAGAVLIGAAAGGGGGGSGDATNAVSDVPTDVQPAYEEIPEATRKSIASFAGPFGTDGGSIRVRPGRNEAVLALDANGDIRLAGFGSGAVVTFSPDSTSLVLATGLIGPRAARQGDAIRQTLLTLPEFDELVLAVRENLQSDRKPLDSARAQSSVVLLVNAFDAVQPAAQVKEISANRLPKSSPRVTPGLLSVFVSNEFTDTRFPLRINNATPIRWSIQARTSEGRLINSIPYEVDSETSEALVHESASHGISIHAFQSGNAKKKNLETNLKTVAEAVALAAGFADVTVNQEGVNDCIEALLETLQFADIADNDRTTYLQWLSQTRSKAVTPGQLSAVGKACSSTSVFLPSASDLVKIGAARIASLNAWLKVLEGIQTGVDTISNGLSLAAQAVYLHHYFGKSYEAGLCYDRRGFIEDCPVSIEFEKTAISAAPGGSVTNPYRVRSGTGVSSDSLTESVKATAQLSVSNSDVLRQIGGQSILANQAGSALVTVSDPVTGAFGSYVVNVGHPSALRPDRNPIKVGENVTFQILDEIGQPFDAGPAVGPTVWTPNARLQPVGDTVGRWEKRTFRGTAAGTGEVAVNFGTMFGPSGPGSLLGTVAIEESDVCLEPSFNGLAVEPAPSSPGITGYYFFALTSCITTSVPMTMSYRVDFPPPAEPQVVNSVGFYDLRFVTGPPRAQRNGFLGIGLPEGATVSVTVTLTLPNGTTVTHTASASG